MQFVLCHSCPCECGQFLIEEKYPILKKHVLKQAAGTMGNQVYTVILLQQQAVYIA